MSTNVKRRDLILLTLNKVELFRVCRHVRNDHQISNNPIELAQEEEDEKEVVKFKGCWLERNPAA